MDYYIWFIAALIFGVLEIYTAGFVVLWFGVAAAIVGLLSLFGVNSLLLQSIIFAVLTLILVTLSRTFFKNVFKYSEGKLFKSTMENLIGKIGVVTISINNELSMGRVLVEGQDWTARSVDSSIIEPNKTVVIVRMEGAKLFVRPQLD